MREIDLLQKPNIKRNFDPNWRTEKNKKIAKLYGKEFFDGDRINGYGGYFYDGRWKKVVERLQEVYGINNESSFLEVGCAKGFLLYDLQEMMPGISVTGLEISEYAVNHAMDGYANYLMKKEQIKSKKRVNSLEKIAKDKVLPHMVIGSAEKLPYADNCFDFVFSSETIHNLPKEKCKKALQEMIRVCKSPEKMFVQVDAYRTEEEKKKGEAWILTGLTFMHTGAWLEFFKQAGYTGDYFWTIFQ